MSTVTATAVFGGSATSREPLGSLAMTGLLLLLCTGGPAATSIQAHIHAPNLAAVVPTDR